MKTAIKPLGVVLTLMLATALTACAHPQPGASTGSATAASTVDPGLSVPAPHADLATHALKSKLRANAPLRYVVKPGDTLWAIAGYYLRDPWYWPQLWQDNPDIANPHLIYPGDVLYLTRNASGAPRLQRSRTERRSPQIREMPLTAAIATIPLDAIRAFLKSPRLVTQKELDGAPYVVSFADEHLVAGAGMEVYVRHADPEGPEQYSVVRLTGPYTDPESGEVLGTEAIPVAELRIEDYGDVSTAVLTRSFREALNGDRLLPIETEDLVHDFYPHAPAEPIEGRIISVQDGVSAIGQYQVVTLNRGRQDGIERGHVLNVFEAGRVVLDPVEGGEIELPDRRAGQLLVFKTDERVSFALIMRARRAIHTRDMVRTPRS